jgi:hypothetical protein
LSRDGCGREILSESRLYEEPGYIEEDPSTSVGNDTLRVSYPSVNLLRQPVEN